MFLAVWFVLLALIQPQPSNSRFCVLPSDKFFGSVVDASFERVYSNCVQRKVFIGFILSTIKNNRKWLSRECFTSLLCQRWWCRSVFFFSASPRHSTIILIVFFIRLVSARIFLRAMNCVCMFVSAFRVLCFVVACLRTLRIDGMRKWTWMRACIFFFCLVSPYMYCLFSSSRTWWCDDGVVGSFTCGSQLAGAPLE